LADLGQPFFLPKLYGYKMKYLFDIECFHNYYLVMFKNMTTGNISYLELHNNIDTPEHCDREKLAKLLDKPSNEIIGFNSTNYDVPMLKAYLAGFSNLKLKKLSDKIILENQQGWQVEQRFGFEKFRCSHVDLANIAAGIASLKLYGGRLKAPTLQDLPIEPGFIITQCRAKGLRTYCVNDLELTELMSTALKEQVALRRTMSKQYKIDLLSKSDAQIAEAVFKYELTKAGVDVYKPEYGSDFNFKFKVPAFINFKTDILKGILKAVKEATFKLSDKGSVLLPKSLHKRFDFDGAKYKFGIGGLHSSEKSQAITIEEDEILKEKDVTSFYPFIILNQGLYPEHLSSKFNTVYRKIVETRVAAKKSGDKAVNESLKVVINSSFGKFGSKYSALYSPSLLVQTTITGQLSLLMLIEMLTDIGVCVVSANTDGLVLKYNKNIHDDVEKVSNKWQRITNFNLEDTHYKALYSRDVNNYLAVKPDGSYKGKGIFTMNTLSKNQTGNICYMAIIEFIINGVPVENTILNHTDISDFLSIRTVAGGALYNGVLIGKAIRWYYSKNVNGFISYKKNGNKVGKTDGAKPMLKLHDTIPCDLDYQHYIKETKEILKDIGL